jgi:hypothetical protein
MSESDIERQKRAKVGFGKGRQNAANDATPDIQSVGITKEKATEQDDKKRTSSRGNRSRQH